MGGYWHHISIDNHSFLYRCAMTTVVNKYKVNMDDPDIVYIGRGSVWGNPYPMRNQSEDERSRVIDKFKGHLWKMIQKGDITHAMLLGLDGKRLACYCAPKACHGDVLVKAIEWAVEQTQK